jgi:hypothetical protein
MKSHGFLTWSALMLALLGAAIRPAPSTAIETDCVEELRAEGATQEIALTYCIGTAGNTEAALLAYRAALLAGEVVAEGVEVITDAASDLLPGADTASEAEAQKQTLQEQIADRDAALERFVPSCPDGKQDAGKSASASSGERGGDDSFDESTDEATLAEASTDWILSAATRLNAADSRPTCTAAEADKPSHSIVDDQTQGIQLPKRETLAVVNVAVMHPTTTSTPLPGARDAGASRTAIAEADQVKTPTPTRILPSPRATARTRTELAPK